MLRYHSTRNTRVSASPSEAILTGLAPDGGLYIPDDIGALKVDVKELLNKDYRGMAEEIFAKFFPDLAERTEEIVKKSYENKFSSEKITPLAETRDGFILELFHGPTCAFKDVALSALPNLMKAAARETGYEDKIMILTATSGDTGSAAMKGFSDVPGTSIVVFYPDEGISDIQRLQMTTQPAHNVTACAIRGNFDSAQRGVKEIFRTMPHPAEGVSLSSANSINIGRLVPQVVYYFSAYRQLMDAGKIEYGDKVDFTVPTGNFGDIMAGWFAKRMGLPVGQLICASNRNDVLTEFLETGHYDRKRTFYKTSSPSMDILVSSNLERLLAFVCGPEKTAEYMGELDQNGEYRINEEELKTIRDDFTCASCSDDEGAGAIRRLYEEDGYLIDTHTAIACAAAGKLRAAGHIGENQNVVLSTASAYKFPHAVLQALGREAGSDDRQNVKELEAYTGISAPDQLKSVFDKPVVSRDVIDGAEMADYVREKVKSDVDV